jgi:hypothetical protein
MRNKFITNAKVAGRITKPLLIISTLSKLHYSALARERFFLLAGIFLSIFSYEMDLFHLNSAHRNQI